MAHGCVAHKLFSSVEAVSGRFLQRTLPAQPLPPLPSPEKRNAGSGQHTARSGTRGT